MVLSQVVLLNMEELKMHLASPSLTKNRIVSHKLTARSVSSCQLCKCKDLCINLVLLKEKPVLGNCFFLEENLTIKIGQTPLNR